MKSLHNKCGKISVIAGAGCPLTSSILVETSSEKQAPPCLQTTSPWEPLGSQVTSSSSEIAPVRYSMVQTKTTSYRNP